MSRAVASLVTLVAVALGACSATATTPAPSPLQSALAAAPSASTPISTAPPALAGALVGRWAAPPRPIPGVASANASLMALTARSLVYYPDVEPDAPLASQLDSSVVGVSGTTVQWRMAADGAGCHVGDLGTYELTVSPSGRALTISGTSDPCAARAAALAGIWTRVGCSTDAWCLGDLDPGRHESVNYTPLGRSADYTFGYGRFSYTVPEGWSNYEDNRTGYVLLRPVDPEQTGIFLFTDPRAHAQGSQCPFELAKGISGSAPAMTRWIESLPGLAVTNVRAVAIGGLHGTAMDLRIASSWKGRCPGAAPDEVSVPLLVSATDTDFEWGFDRGTHMRLYVLGIDADRALIVDVEAQDAATWADLVHQADPIVHTFTFTP